MDKFKEIIENLELHNIYLSKINSSANHELFTENMQVNIHDDANYKYENGKFIIFDNFTLKAKNNNNDIALEVSCTFVLNFLSPTKVDDKFFEMFKKTSLPFNIWPYFREQVNNITSRMNVPPLTIPLLKRK